MNLTKSYEFFQPEKVSRCHVIGCGSVGSTVAELLVRLGLTKISLYDFDVVQSRNIANQLFVESDIGRPKTEALRDMLVAINPEVAKDITICGTGWQNGKARLSGYVFLCVDDVDTRRAIVTSNRGNATIKAMFDFRTRLTDAQHYAAKWDDPKSVNNLLKSMDFTNEQADAATPVSACNVPLCVAPTVRIICSFGVANFMDFVKGKRLMSVITVDAFNFETDAF